MDMDMARDALVQEARELLDAMEAALLQIEASGADSEAINAIFRAAHTIKGSAGLFAFNRIVSFTHIVESVLDRVRTGKLPIDAPMLSLLLNCGDYIAQLVDAIAARVEEVEPDPARRAELEEQLNQLLGEPAQTHAAPAPAPVASAIPAAQTSVVEDPVNSPYWHLSLRFLPDVLRMGLDPLSFLQYLGNVGTLLNLRTLPEGLPPLAQLDPEQAYLGFELDLQSEEDRAAIDGVFDFIRDDASIVILSPHAPMHEYRTLLALRPDPQMLAEVLAQGTLTADEAARALLPPEETVESVPVNAPVVMTETAAKAPAARQGEDKKGGYEQKFIKVEVSKLDLLIDLVGELVIAGAGASLIANRRKDSQFEEAVQSIAELVEHIRDAALNLRMVPIGEVFQRFPRVVRDISHELGKEIDLVVTGADTELDKSMVERLSDPLMHIVRNAMDHGIEATEARLAAGKPAAGTLRLNAFHESGSIVIEVSDDGRGLNKARILAKAIERGLVTAEQSLAEHEVFRLIFEAGFSTAEQVTNLSGRGVGMDVVKKNIESLRGEVEMLSTEGAGTTVRIRLPLTLAIIDGFQVMVNESIFVIPLDLVIECIDLAGLDGHHDIVKLRGEPLPFIRLRELFELPRLEHGRESLVVVQFGQQRAGLVVDRLLGEFQAVIKPLGELFSRIKSISGSTILGDGKVALILDVANLVHQAVQQQAAPQNSKAAGSLASPQKSNG
ncbi:two-component system chemotaxis sensor kinase CheA [Silvimonas terrae]|uniref:Chemotaxis protein CheA n=1 Tax=Silvimonas terrae TaxID=300266 RepID=A0A840RH24_9NEIS|nr:chemotaxis protein CheA [Silvimonas terrae]MBB5191626.1 two-component system chemotaxis sensor kinase CheA [Silvimonas terrae]